MSSQNSKNRIFIAAFILFLGLGLNAYANPQGETVVAGSVSFDRSTANTLNINTASNKTIVNFNGGFNIAQNETTNINQPNAGAAFLGRDVSGNPSAILGKLNSNGQIFLVNTSGIIFGAGSQVNAPAIVASTLDIANSDFLAGKYNFYKNGGNAYIINQGRIAAQPGGFIALLSQSVQNQGVILADLGTIALASGNKMTVALDSQNQISVVIDQAVDAQVIGPDGKKIASAISNSGTIQANGGKIILTAQVMNKVFDYAVNNSGVVAAGAISNNGGTIELTASGAPVVNTGSMTANTVNINVLNADLLNQGSITAALLGSQANTGNILINAVNILQAGLIAADAEVDLTALAAIETDPAANGSYPVGGLIKGSQVNLTAAQFGSADTPLNINGNNISITVPQGNIDIAGSSATGNNINLRGPPAGFGSITYNSDANLTLNASTGSINIVSPAVISANNLTLTANNSITNDGSIIVGDTLNLSTNGYDINAGLIQAPILNEHSYHFSTTGTLTGGSAFINDTDGAATLSGNQGSNVTDTSISLSGNVTLTANNLVFTATGGAFNAAGFSIDSASGQNYNLTISVTGSSTLGPMGQTQPLGNLTLNSGSSSRTYTMGGAINLAGNLTIGSNTTLSAGSNTIALGGNLTNSGTFTAGTSTVNYDGTTAQTITALNYNNLTISGAHTTNNITLASSGTIGIAGTFTTSATFTSGGYVITGSTVNYNGTGAQTITAFNYNNLTISGAHTTNNITLASSGTIGISGTFTTSATFTSGVYVVTGSTVNFNGTSAQTVPTGIGTYNILKSNNTAGVTLGGAKTITTLTIGDVIANSIFNDGGFTITPGASSALNLTSGTYDVGASTFPAYSTVTIASGTTVNYDATGVQTIAAQNYANLTISAARTSHNVTLASSGTIGISGTFTTSATFSSGGYVITGSTVNYNGTGAQTITAFNYNNLTISGAYTTNNITLASSGTIGIAGTFTTSATFTSGGYVITGSTVNYNGTGAQTITAFNYNNLTISGAHTTNNITLASSGTIGIAGTFTTSATFSSGAYVVTGSTVNFNGTSAQTVPTGIGTYNILKSNNTAGVTLGGAETITTLTIGDVTSNSIFNDGGFTITPGASSALNLTSGTYDVGASTLPAYSTITIASGTTVNYDAAGVQTVDSITYYNLTVSGSGNKTVTTGTVINGIGTISGSAKVLQTVTAAVTGGGKIYDGTTAATVTLSAFNPFSTWYTVTYSDTSATYVSKNVAAGITVNVSGISLGGTNASSFVLSSTSATTTGTITPKVLTMSGLSVPSTKVYDGTTTAVVSGTSVLTGSETAGSGTTSDGKSYTGDTVSITGTATGTYNSKDVASATTVTFGGLSLTGAQAGNYTLTIESPVSATVTPKALTETGLTVPGSKIYDGTTAAVISGTAALSSSETAGSGTTSDGKRYTGDTVTITGTATGTYNSKDVASATAVTFGGLTLTGAQAGDYTLTMQSPASAAITPKTLTSTLTNTGVTKVYNGTTAAPTGFTPTYNVTGFISGDTAASISNTGAAYNSDHVAGANQVTVSGLAITGITGSNSSAASDYVLSSSSNTVAATITPATLTSTLTNSGVTKIYNGTTAAPAGFTPTYNVTGFISGDTSASISNTGAAYNSDHVVGANQVTVSGLAITGITGSNSSAASDYVVNSSTSVTATITPATLTSTLTNAGVTKVYNGTTAAPAGFTPTYNVTGFISGDTAASISNTGAAYNSDHVAGANQVTVSGLTITGITGSNSSAASDYVVNSSTSVTATITPATLTSTLTNSGVTKVYDGTTAAPAGFTPTYNVIGFISGDTSASISNTGAVYNSDHVAGANQVTVSGLTITGITGSNSSAASDYVLSSGSNTVAATITPATLTSTLTNAGVTKVYNGTTAAPAGFTSTYNVTGFIAGDTAASISNTGAAYNSDHVVGANQVTVSGLAITGITGSNSSSASDYVLSSGSNTVAAAITPATLSATIASSSSTYGSSLNSGTVSLIGVIGSDDVSSIASVNTSTLSSSGKPIAGSYTQTAGGITGADAGNYSFAGFTSAANYTINKLALTGTAIGTSSSTYGSSLNAGAVSFGNIVSGDIVSSSASVDTSTLSSSGNPIAGSYTQTAGGISGADAANYSFAGFTTPVANYTINKLALTGTAIGTSSSTYGSSLNAGAVSFGNIVSGDIVSSSASVDTSTLSSSGNPIAGSYTQTAGGISGADAANYSFAGFTTPVANYTINKLALTGTAIGTSSSTYGSSLNAGAVSFGNIVSGDIVSSSASVDTSTLSSSGNPIAGSYTQTAGGITGADAANYSFAGFTSAANYTINKLTLTGTAIGTSSSTYGSSLNAGAVSFGNIVSGDIVSSSASVDTSTLSSSGNPIAGSYTQTAGGISGADAANYSFAGFTSAANYTINKLTLTGTAIGTSSSTYGSSLNAGAVSFGNIVSGDIVSSSASVDTSTLSSSNNPIAGSYTQTAGGITGAAAANYSFAGFTSAANYTINKLTLTGTAIGTSSSTYGSSLNAGAVSFGNIVSGDIVSSSASVDTSTLSSSNNPIAGSYTQTAGGITGADAANYSFAGFTSAANYTINKLALTGTGIGTSSSTYGSSLNAGAVSFGNIVSGDIVSSSASVDTSTLSSSNNPIAGSYTQTANGISGADAANYSFAGFTSAANYTINKLTLTGTGIGTSSSTYGSALNAGTVSFGNIVSGDIVTDTASVNTSTLSSSGKPIAGSYTQTAGGITGADAANYSFAGFTSAANYTINKLALSGTAIGTSSSTYGSALNAGTVSFGNVISGDIVTDTASVNTSTLSSSGKPIAGSYTQTAGGITGADAANYSFAGFTSAANYTINKLALTGTGIGTSSSTYGSSLNAGAVSFGNIVSGDIVSSSASVDTSTLSSSNNPIAGSYTQTAGGITGADAANYSFAGFTSAANYTINKLTLTGTGIGTSSSTYGSSLNAGAVSFGNIVSGDIVSSSASVDTSTLSSSNNPIAGSYTQTANGISGADAANYSFAGFTSAANYTINKLTLTGTGIGTSSSTYGSSLNAGAVSFGNIVSGDIVSSSASVDTSTLSSSNNPIAGSYTQTAGGITGADAANYSFAGFTSAANYTINKLALTVTAAGINKVYDGTTNATVTLSDNRVAGDVLTDSYTSAAFGSKNVVTGGTVSVSGISISGTDAGNYTFNTTASTTANITPKALTVTATGIDKVYDGTSNATVTLSDDRVAGDVFTDSYTSAAFGSKNVVTGGTVSVSGISISGTDAGNYTFNTTASTTASITPKALTVSATGVDKVYDGTSNATVTLSDDRVAGDVLIDSYASAAFGSKNVVTGGTVSVSGISISGTDAANYTFNTTASTTANITPKALTVSATGIDKIYDGTSNATVTLSDDRVAGDVFTDSYTSAAFGSKNVVTGGTVSVSGISISGTDAGNYTFNTTASTTASITPKALTVTATGIDKVYDGTSNATVTLSDDRVAGDVFTDSYTSAAFGSKNVVTGGTVSVSGISISGTDAGNYTLSNTTATTTANITPASLTITATNQTLIYGNSNLGTSAFTSSGLQNGETVGSVTLNTDATLSTSNNYNVGTWTITPSAATGGTFSPSNYNITYSTGVLTVNPAGLPLLTVTATGVNKIDDGTTNATVTLSDNRVAGDVLTDSYASANFATTIVGNGRTITVNGISISGPDAGNYTLANTTATTTANITPNPATILGQTLLGGGVNRQLQTAAGGVPYDHRLGSGFENQPTFFFYHPLTDINSSSFDNISLDAGAYDFIEDELKHHKGMLVPSFFGTL